MARLAFYCVVAALFLTMRLPSRLFMSVYPLMIAAYLLGSVSFAVIVCRAGGWPDPRTLGSGNAGATNVMRVGGRWAAAITLVGDVLKGVAPVAAGHAAGLTDVALTVVGAAAFLGHLYPLFFGFRGGKGVATVLGVLLGVQLWLGVAVGLTWLLVARVFRISSLSALVATGLAPLYAVLLGVSYAAVAVMAVMVALLWWRHRANIGRLLSGAERPLDRH